MKPMKIKVSAVAAKTIDTVACMLFFSIAAAWVFKTPSIFLTTCDTRLVKAEETQVWLMLDSVIAGEFNTSEFKFTDADHSGFERVKKKKSLNTMKNIADSKHRVSLCEL